MSEALIVIDMQVDFCGSDCEPVAEVVERLVAAARRAGVPVIWARRYSAFIGTDLEIRLRAMGATELICCGLRTNVCVESTVRDAFQRDIATVVVADGCKSADHSFHEAALRNIQAYFGRVLSSGEVLARWSAPTMARQAVPSETRAQP